MFVCVCVCVCVCYFFILCLPVCLKGVKIPFQIEYFVSLCTCGQSIAHMCIKFKIIYTHFVFSFKVMSLNVSTTETCSIYWRTNEIYCDLRRYVDNFNIYKFVVHWKTQDVQMQGKLVGISKVSVNAKWILCASKYVLFPHRNRALLWCAAAEIESLAEMYKVHARLRIWWEEVTKGSELATYIR